MHIGIRFLTSQDFPHRNAKWENIDLSNGISYCSLLYYKIHLLLSQGAMFCSRILQTFSETRLLLPLNSSGAIHGSVPRTPPDISVFRLILDNPKSPTCRKQHTMTNLEIEEYKQTKMKKLGWETVFTLQSSSNLASIRSYLSLILNKWFSRKWFLPSS